MNYAATLRGGTALVRPALNAMPRISTVNSVMDAFDTLTKHACQRLIRNMVSFGNTLSEAHCEALKCILGRFTMLASGANKGRYAYDLPCGGGKTQAVVAWCAELWHQKQPYSVMVCQTQVEHLCDLKRQLINNGVPCNEIGLIHSYGDKASLPATTDNKAKKIVLVTHQKVRNGRDIGEVNTYQDHPRDLIIWDESLLVSDHMSVEKMQVEQAYNWLKPIESNERASNDLKAALNYLGKAWNIIEAEHERQSVKGAAPRKLILPEVMPDALERMIMAIPNHGATGAVRNLLAISQSPLRVVTSSQGGGGLIKYDVVVPKELRNVAVLDASWAIRDLERLDQTIKRDPCFAGDVKSFHNLTINHMIHRSGRQAMTEEFSGPRSARKISKEIATVVKGIPEGEGVLIFTFKHSKSNQVDMKAKLEGDLRADGIDVDALLPNDKPRFAWLTWGRETSTSEYQYCSNVIFAGVLHRSDVDLAGAIAGQKDDLTANIDQAEITKIKRSEIAHNLLQAMNRAACRNTFEGEAKATNVWLMHHDTKVRSLLDEVLPGVKWVEWKAEYLQAKTPKIETATRQLIEHLDGICPFIDKVSFKKVNQYLNLGIHSSKLSIVRGVALESLPDWTYEGYSFVRAGT